MIDRFVAVVVKKQTKRLGLLLLVLYWRTSLNPQIKFGLFNILRRKLTCPERQTSVSILSFVCTCTHTHTHTRGGDFFQEAEIPPWEHKDRGL